MLFAGKQAGTAGHAVSRGMARDLQWRDAILTVVVVRLGDGLRLMECLFQSSRCVCTMDEQKRRSSGKREVICSVKPHNNVISGQSSTRFPAASASSRPSQ